jgi:hypothetical protein
VTTAQSVFLEPPQQRGPHAAPARLDEHARHQEGALAHARAVGNPATDNDALELHEEAQLFRRLAGPDLRHRERPLVRMHRRPHRAPRLEIGVRLSTADGDHPDRLSLPCRFA